jgi:hypothetical protein
MSQIDNTGHESEINHMSNTERSKEREYDEKLRNNERKERIIRKVKRIRMVSLIIITDEMMKVKFKVVITEEEINEAYIGRQRNMEEKIIEQEIEIYDKKGLELYKKNKK